jgi:uncharacterized Fe-S center protein
MKNELKTSSSNVYLLAEEEYSTINKMSEALRYVLEYRRLPFFKNYWSKQLVGIKPSCIGGPECRNYLFSLINEIAISLKTKDVSAFMCDTSNRHKNISSNALEQIRESYCDCISNADLNLPVFMLDGINGSYEQTKKINGHDVFLAGELPHLDGLILITSSLRHQLCGLSGALYNLGAGLASKKGKIKQRTLGKPRVNVDKCYSCKNCLHACPVEAIFMEDNHVVIDEKKCIDCGRCVEIARRCGISYYWDATPGYFQEKFIDYAAGAMLLLKTTPIFVNIINDAAGDKNGSVLISKDPLAIDKATLDICNKKKLFDKENLELMNDYILKAEAMKLGNINYKIEKIAY